MNNIKLVITGVGFYTSLGYTKQNLWDAIYKSYMEPAIWSGNICKDKLIYRIEDMSQADDIIRNRKIKRLDNFTKWLCAAAQLALEDSKLLDEDRKPIYDEMRTGSIVTTVQGPMNITYSYLNDLYTNGPSSTRPLLFQQTVNNVACGQMAIQNKLKGVSSTLIGASSIGYAIELMRKGEADIIIVGGLEELNEYMIEGYERRGVLNSKNSNNLSLPWRKSATGIIPGEGAGVIVIETLEHATKRGAKIYAEIIGETSVTDERFCKSFDEFDEFDSTGIYRAMTDVLERYNINPEYIDCISLASNSMKNIDSIEQKAIKDIFGERNNIGYIASKAFFGETLGASEILSVIASLLCMEKESIPGLKYLETDQFANNKLKSEICMVNSFFPGGSVNSIILKKGD